MANIEDYLPGGKNDPNAQADGIEAEIIEASEDQTKRKEDATPVDWEERYKNLEVLNSQQSQTVGEYRRVIDDYILNPTSESEPTQEEPKPITSDDLYENPDEAVNRAIANHPAIKRAQDIEQQFEAQERDRSVAGFRESHPDFEDIKGTPEFASWVYENPTRVALANAADKWDMNSADALFSLYKAEKGITKMQNEAKEAEAIQAASLEDSSAVMVTDEPKFSRGEFVDMKMKASQGDLDAERWVNRHIAAYRAALESGNVRD
ncbi:MAG: hypothetical protein ACXABY_12740 [Candidatus Thorarchaeota archaeon]|jgi:hypothetical protein